MAVRYQTKGFLIREEVQGEADKIFIFYTENFGRIKILGRAIRKIKSKLKGGIKLFSLSRIEFIEGKNYKTLTDAAIEKDFQGIKKSLIKLRTAYKISESIDSLIKGQEKDKEIWNLLNDAFSKINDCPQNLTRCLLIYYYFFWNFVSVLGYGLNLRKCSICRSKLSPGEIYFNLKEGIICSHCFRKIGEGNKISPEIIELLRLFLNKDWKTLLRLKISSKDLDLLNLISEEYFKKLKE